MATAQSIINGALRNLGALPEGASASVARSVEALEILNTLLDSWQLDNYLIYAETIVPHTLVVGDVEYTIGPSGADIAAPRPVALIGAYLTVNGLDYPPLEVLSDDQYAAIPTKTVRSIPDKINFAAAFPLASVRLYPVPEAAFTLNLRLNTPLQSFAALSTDYAMPSGHKRALVTNLALELAPSEEKEPSALLVSQARESKALVRSNVLRNASPPLSVIELAGAGGARWNFNTGD